MKEKIVEQGCIVRVGNTTITTQRTFGNADMVDSLAKLVAKRIQAAA